MGGEVFLYHAGEVDGKEREHEHAHHGGNHGYGFANGGDGVEGCAEGGGLEKAPPQ